MSTVARLRRRNDLIRMSWNSSTLRLVTCRMRISDDRLRSHRQSPSRLGAPIHPPRTILELSAQESLLTLRPAVSATLEPVQELVAPATGRFAGLAELWILAGRQARAPVQLLKLADHPSV